MPQDPLPPLPGPGPLPPHVIESMKRQVRESVGMPTRPAGEVIEEIRRKLQEFEDAQRQALPSGERAVA